MKRILLIIAITFLIFQMVVLATAIDIGSPAIERAGGASTNTIILKDNPANESGRITSIEIYAGTEMANCEVATFYSTGEDTFSTRDTHTIGTVTAGSKQTFSDLDITVQTGDYIGTYFSGGILYFDTTGGTGYWSKAGDNIPCTTTEFTSYSDYIFSLYGTGTTEAAPTYNFFGYNSN